MFVVVSYDIANDRRRGKVHKIMRAYGQWVQYSVFECDLDKKDYLRLRHRLGELIKKDEDHIRFYLLCDTCNRRIERIGGPEPLGDGPVIV